MNVDLEAAGELASATLVAREIEAGHGKAAPAHGGHCANCGVPLAGAFCHQCGQNAHVHRSLLHMGEELLHGILHFDGKALRTLPMLVAFPGQLTRRYIEGQRTRHVSPMALFLFMIFLMFFTASYTSSHNIAEAPGELKDAAVKLEKRAARARLDVAEAQARLAAAPASGGDAAALSDGVAEAKEGLAEAEEALAAIRSVTKPEKTPGAPDSGSIGVSKNLNVSTGIASIDAAFEKAMKNPELALYKLKNAASKFSFLLVPISLPFLWLMFFWKRGVTMYDHAVFSLYSLSFMALMFVIIMLLNRAGLGGMAVTLFFVVPPLHMFRQLKGSYALGTAAALWRTMALLFAAGLVFVLYLVLIVVLTVQ